MTREILQSVGTAVVVAIIFAFVKLFRDVHEIRVAHKYEVEAIKLEVSSVVTWYRQTSMDALKIATNPTSERLAELADRYIAGVRGEQGKRPLNTQEKDELIEGLREVMNNPKEYASKRQSASMSLRFIETREGITAKSNH